VANNRLNEQHALLARLLIDRTEDFAGRKSLADHFGCLAITRSASFLAQYDMNSFFTMRFIFHGIFTMVIAQLGSISRKLTNQQSASSTRKVRKVLFAGDRFNKLAVRRASAA
jgi:hypothetical protein